MMRKVIWCGTALLACVAIAATMAAYYVAENPDSLFAQATVAASDMCSWFNPLLAMNRVPAPVVCADKPCPKAEPWMPPPDVPQAEPQEPPRPEVGEVPPVVEPIVVEDILLPVIQETQEPAFQQPPDLGEQVPFMNPSHETAMEDAPAFMPYADDDEAVLNQAQMDKPDFMTQLLGCFMNPECHSQELGCTVFAQAVADFLKDLVGEDSDTTEVPAPPEEPVEDGTLGGGEIGIGALAGHPPAAENPNTGTPASEEPVETIPPPISEEKKNDEGSNATGAGVGAVIGAQPDKLPPTGAADPTTGAQDNYPPKPENTNLQEDPSYHHQYPSCPYTGQCPNPGHCPYPYYYNVPSVPYTEPAPQPAQPAEIIKPKKPAKVKPTKPGKPVQEITPMSDLETYGVDTMECRPTDVSGYLPGTGPF
jgi:hypothetical protein